MANLELIVKAFVVSFALIGVSNVSYSQINEAPPVPYNGNYLYKYGISPKVFNLLLSPMYQEEVSFSADWNLSENFQNNVTSVNLQMDYDPYYEYGNQLFVIVRDENIYDYKSKRQIKRYVALQNEKFKNLKDFSLVNENSIQFLRQEGDSTILEFSLRKPLLPWKLKHIGSSTGRIYLLNNELQKISLNSVKQFKADGVSYSNYTSEVSFKGDRDLGYLFDQYHMSGSGTKQGEPYSYSETLDIISYQDKEKRILTSFEGGAQKPEQFNEQADTFSIQLERSLPFLGNAARKAGYELPQPWGVNLFNHFQKESYSMNAIVLNGVNLSDLVFEEGGSIADVDIGVTAAMGDVWILPFLNFSVLYGRIYGNTNVSLELNDEMKDILGWIGEPADALDFSVDVGGSIAGLGMTVAGGYKNLFGTVASQYVVQTAESAGTTVGAFVVTPLIGLRMPKFVNIMVGAQYQYTNNKVSGSFQLSGADNTFSLNLEPKTWNFMAGLQRDISNHWTGAFQIGMGNRKSSTLVIGYRF